MDSDNKAYLWTILNTVLKNMFCVRKWNVSLRHFFYMHKIYIWQEMNWK